MVRAIREVHTHSIIHRDIKPSNFRMHQGKLYLFDFGCNQRYIDKETKMHI